jgi:PAS domain S-box-containing protein
LGLPERIGQNSIFEVDKTKRLVTGSRFSVLVIEPNAHTRSLIEKFLAEGFDSSFIIHADSIAQGKKHLKTEENLGAIVTGISDFKWVEALLSLAGTTPVTVITPKISIKKSPGADYLLLKELSAFQLFKSISYGVHRSKEQERMRQAADSNRIFFLQSPVPKWIYEAKSLRFIDVNQAAINLYGFSRDEFLSMTLKDISDPESPARPVHKGITRHRKKDGSVIDVQVDASLIEYEGRKVRIAVCIDVTARLQSDRALRANERRFKSLIQGGGDLITILSPDGYIKYTSPNHEIVLGYKKDFLVGQNIAEFVHPEDYQETISLYKALLTKRRVFSSVFRFRHGKGHWVWIESIATNAMRDESISGFVVNSRDVSDRVENENRLRKSNERFEAIVRASSDAIYDHDLRSRKIFIAGANYKNLFGYTFPNDTTDVDFYKSCIHPDDRDYVFNFLSKSILNPKKTHFELEYRLRRTDTTWANILDRYNILWEHGLPVRKIGAMQDITSRKFQETLLALEKEIYELNANPKISFDVVINKLTKNICELIPDAVSAIASVDDEMNFSHLACVQLGDDYIQAIHNRAATGSNLFGGAVKTGKIQYTDDLQSAHNWSDLKPIIDSYGFKSAWAIPVKKRSGKVIALLAMFFTSTRQPGRDDSTLIERISNLISILIENRHAVEETEAAKERYDIVAKATSDTIWDWKIQEDTFSWNKGIQGVFGYKRDQVGNTSKWWFDRIHPEDSIRLSVKLYNFLEEKVEKWQDEYRFKCADGSYKYVFDRGFLVKDKDGRPVRMITSMQDVTHQKQEEQRLKLLETVVTETKDSVIITESEKSGRSIPKIVFVNPAFTTMTGYKASEVVGKSPAIFMGRKSLTQEIARLTHALRNKKEFKFETLNHRKNGEEYWINFSMIPITNKEGEHSHWISIQRDITEEKKQEKEKEQLIRELTQNNKDLKQFSYITSHNLRAPLSNLTGLINLMQDIPIENGELRELLNGFTKSTNLLNETINDLVKVVIIKDSPSIEKEEVQIDEVFENVFNQLSVLISANKPIIRFSFEKVAILNINKSYLESILLNLLTNAIKYRSPHRQLRINIKTKVVGNTLVLTFKDNGIGIDLKRNADKIFGLYQRFHDYPDSKGLGLYLVKSQVEAMGGTISVQSEVDKGTLFTLTFKMN